MWKWPEVHMVEKGVLVGVLLMFYHIVCFFFIIWAHVQALMLLADPFPQLANSVQSELNFKQARICCDPPAACQTVLQSSPEGANSTESVDCQLL